jgi:PAS domain S-box-containing protein
VLVTNHDGLIVHVNRAFIQITGYQSEEVLGQRPSLFKSGRHPAAFYQAMFATLQSKGEWSGKSGTVAKAAKSIRSGRPFADS